MFDETKLVHFTHKKHISDVTTYHFSRAIDNNKHILAEIEVVWNKKNGVTYEIMLIEISNELNKKKTYSFISISKESWFQKNLELIIDFHRRSFELSSVFRSNE